METDAVELASALSALASFGVGPRLTARISDVECELRGLDLSRLGQTLQRHSAVSSVLSGAMLVKRVSRQIDVTIHALGILLALPGLLEEGEVIEALSLGTGNTGRPYDLETDRRIAEFKFIACRAVQSRSVRTGCSQTSSGWPRQRPPSVGRCSSSGRSSRSSS